LNLDRLVSCPVDLKPEDIVFFLPFFGLDNQPFLL